MTAITIPILPSADFDASATFWAAFGFAERGRWPAEYLVLRHEELAIELHFWHDPTVDRWTNDVGCYVRFDTPAEAEACRQGWDGVEVLAPGDLSPLRVGPAGPPSVEFHVIDTQGNLVRFGGFPPS